MMNDSSNDTDRVTSFYPDEWITLIVTPPIVILGLIGNVLAIIVYASKEFRSTHLAIYLIILAVVDSLILLLNGLVNNWIWILFNRFDIRVISQAGCKILVYLLYVSQMFGGWLISALNLERAIVVTLPFKSKTLITKARVAMAIGVMVLVILLLNLYIPILYTTNHARAHYCGLADTYQYVKFPAFSLMDMIVYSLLPSIILIICNIVLIIHLRKSSRRWSRYREGNSEIDNNRHRSTRRITILCVVIGTTYLIFTLPFTALLLYVYFTPDKFIANWPTGYVVLYEFNLVNSAINILLYSISAPSFRSSFMVTICRRQPVDQPVTRITSLSAKISTDAKENLNTRPSEQDNDAMTRDSVE